MNTQIITESADESISQNAETGSMPGTASEGGMLCPGEDVEGYRIDGLLSSSGGEAEVYICVKDGEKYVLKYYYTKKPNPEMVEKVRAFSCPNIISIMHYGEYKGRFFTVLEYAAGGALDDRLPDGSYKYLPLGDSEALQIVRETLSAFEACHKAGIIHRDIKPGNLLYKNLEILPDGRCRGSGILLGDFGIASIFEVDSGMSKHMTETGARTEGYAAPEFAYEGDKVIGPEVDYYSLGITLWVLLTGMEPFVNENGQVMYSGEITLNTIQGKTVEKLLSRSPQLSPSMQKLIRGLLTVRHEKRWKQDEITRHLAGENVELFNEAQALPLVEIGGESCSSYKEIAAAIIKHPEEGKKFVFRGGLGKYLVKIDQKLTDRLIDVIESYSADNREDDGAVFVAFSLCPNMDFPLGHGLSIRDMEGLFTVLNTEPDAILPYLRDEKKGLYAYFEAAGLGEQGKRVKEIVNSTAGDIRAVSRIITAFQGNEIRPFQDGINNDLRLTSLEDLYELPAYLKERVMIFIERNYGLVPAWIENLTGKDIDSWLAMLSGKKEIIARWGAWEYFTLFMQGLAAYDKIQKNGGYVLFEKGGKKALYRCAASADRAKLLCSVETGDNTVVLKKENGTSVFSGSYIVNLNTGYDRDGISTLPFVDAEGKMAASDGLQLYYLNINSERKVRRNELKEGEIALLTGLKNIDAVINVARCLREQNNFSDMNLLIDAAWNKFGQEAQYASRRNLLRLIDKDRMTGLSNSFDFYLSEIGNTFYMERSYQEALPYWDEALDLNSSRIGSDGHSYYMFYAEALNQLGSQGNWEKALVYLDKAMQITPRDPLPLAIKGSCLYNLDKYNEAIACLTMALNLKAEKRRVLPLRAKCYDALGMTDKADKDRREGA